MNNEAVYDRQRIVRRSKLYIPVNRDKFVDKAWTRNADVIILDLEDSIPYQQKDAARKKVETAVPIVMRGDAEVQVRINRTCQDNVKQPRKSRKSMHTFVDWKAKGISPAAPLNWI